MSPSYLIGRTAKTCNTGSVTGPQTGPVTRRGNWIGDRPRNRASHSMLVPKQREDVVARELLAAAEELELDDERQADDLAAELLDQLDRRLRRAAGREHVVVDQHPLPRDDRVRVYLQGVEPVLERVLRRHGPPRQLPGLSRRDEPAAEPARERAAGDVAARLRAEHEVGLLRLRPLRDPLHRLPQRFGKSGTSRIFAVSSTAIRSPPRSA